MIDRDDIGLWLEVFAMVLTTFVVIIGWIGIMTWLVAGGHEVLAVIWFIGVPAVLVATAAVWAT